MKGSVGSAFKPSLDAIQKMKDRSLVKGSAKISKIIENAKICIIMFVNQNGLIIVPILLYLFLNVCESIHNQPLLHTKITLTNLLLT